MSETKLLPCPFCGGKAEIEWGEYDLDSGWHVICVGKKECPLYCSRPYVVFHDKRDAFKTWNTRTSEARLREAVEALEHYADEKNWACSYGADTDRHHHSASCLLDMYDRIGNGYDIAAAALAKINGETNG